MKRAFYTTTRIKQEIQKGMTKLTNSQLIMLVKENMRSNADTCVLQFTFALNELENRMTPQDYAELEESLFNEQ